MSGYERSPRYLAYPRSTTLETPLEPEASVAEHGRDDESQGHEGGRKTKQRFAIPAVTRTTTLIRGYETRWGRGVSWSE